MDTLSLELTAQRDEGFGLHGRLSTTKSDPSTLTEEGTFAQGTAQHLPLLYELPALAYGDGVGVGTVETLEVAPLEEDDETKPRTIKRPHGLEGMNT